MKNILEHRSWNEQEVLAFFDKGSFTMCSLPHYRYVRVQEICNNLKRCGLIERVGKTETGISYKAKPEYHKWRKDVAEGKAPSNLRKLYQNLNPPKLRRKTCPGCHQEFETFDPHQKICSKRCRCLAKANAGVAA